jgi:hypothetical protein
LELQEKLLRFHKYFLVVRIRGWFSRRIAHLNHLCKSILLCDMLNLTNPLDKPPRTAQVVGNGQGQVCVSAYKLHIWLSQNGIQGHRQKSPQAAHFVLRREPFDAREAGRPAAHIGRGGEARPFSAEKADCEVETASKCRRPAAQYFPQIG